jgi:hypothetical protein
MICPCLFLSRYPLELVAAIVNLPSLPLVISLERCATMRRVGSGYGSAPSKAFGHPMAAIDWLISGNTWSAFPADFDAFIRFAMETPPMMTSIWRLEP